MLALYHILVMKKKKLHQSPMGQTDIVYMQAGVCYYLDIW